MKESCRCGSPWKRCHPNIRCGILWERKKDLWRTESNTRLLIPKNSTSLQNSAVQSIVCSDRLRFPGGSGVPRRNDGSYQLLLMKLWCRRIGREEQLVRPVSMSLFLPKTRRTPKHGERMMRKLWILLVVFGLMFAACGKTDGTDNNDDVPAVVDNIKAD